MENIYSPSTSSDFMPNQKLIGIHLGTSSVVVTVYDQDGTVLNHGESLVNEQTSVAWERAFYEATPNLPDDAICSIAGTSGTVLLVDKYGEPIFPPQMYYESATEEANQLSEYTVDEDTINMDIITSPTAPLAKILQIREQHPNQFQQVEWIVSPTTWLLYRLCYGSSEPWQDVETDWTNAMKFGADITASVPTWFESLFNSIDLSTSLFPEIRPPGSYIGVADGEIAKRTGFDGTKLFQGITDGSAFVLANDCLRSGDFSLTFGATSVIKYVSDSIMPHNALYYHRHPIKGYLPGASFESGNILQWFFDTVLDCSNERGIELAKSTPMGEEYTVFPPGNRGPFFDPSIGSSILGLQYDTELSVEEVHGRLARGLVTGIILAEWSYISLIEEHFETNIDVVRVMNEGAPTQEDNYSWWNELRATIWDRPVIEMDTHTTVGPVIPAALIGGVYHSVNDATDSLLQQHSRVTPDPSATVSYESKKQSYLDQWRKIAQLSK